MHCFHKILFFEQLLILHLGFYMEVSQCKHLDINQIYHLAIEQLCHHRYDPNLQIHHHFYRCQHSTDR